MPARNVDSARRRLLGHSALYLAGSVLQRAFGLLLLPFATRILDLEEFAVVTTATVLALLLSVIYGLGIAFAVTRFYYDDPPDAIRTDWAALLRLQIGWASALALVSFATGPLWGPAFDGIGWTAPLKFAVLLGLFISIQETTQGVLLAARRPVAFVSLTLLQTILGGGFGLILASSHGAAGYLGGIAIGSLAAVTIGLLLTYRRPKWNLRALRSGVRLSIPSMLHTLSGWVMDLSDRLLIGVYMGLAAVGRYQVAYLIGALLMLLLTSLQSAWAPHYLGDLSAAERRRLPAALAAPVALVTAALGVLVVLAAPVLLTIAAPPEFSGTETVVALVLSAAIVRAGYFLSVVALQYAKKSRALAVGSGLGAIVNVALCAFFIPVAGLTAAAAATALAVTLQALLVMNQASAILGASVGARSVLEIWGVGTGVLLAASAIPTSLLGHVLRVGVALLCIGVAWRGLGHISSSLRPRSLKGDARGLDPTPALTPT